jgi:uncharacterized protein (DUF1800 family)
MKHRLALALAPWLLLAPVPWQLPAAAQGGEPARTAAGSARLPFGPAEAEHLLNRAAFGAGPERIGAAAAAGLEATLDRLFAPGGPWRDPFFAEDLSPRGGRYRQEFIEAVGERTGEDPDELRERFRDQRPSREQLDELLPREMRQQVAAKLRLEDRLQLDQYSSYWLEGVLGGLDPLRDRLTLFWMGLLTSSNDDVKNSFEMIAQHRFLRDNALSSYRTLLLGIARDPAMLEYLDNDENRKRAPNENFARELLELFTLGEGHYSEADILAAARAFTGWTDRDGVFVFQRNNHDREAKTFLGHTGNFDGEDILRILLEQPRCARYLSDRLIEYFEGQAPEEGRAAAYADLLLRSDYAIEPYLRALFSDPAFYRQEIVGNRIQSPLDFLVGSAQRLGIEPPARLLELGLRALGQRPFYPPSVKGWDEGRAWVTTSAMLQRANLAGVLLGVVGPDELLARAEAAELMDPEDGAGEMMDMAGGGEADAGAADDMPGEPAGAGRRGRPRPERRPESAAAEAGPGLRERLLKGSELLRGLRAVEGIGWQPRIYLAARLEHRGARSDAEVVAALAEELLARPIEPASQAELVALLARERAAIDLPEGALGRWGADGEHLLRRIAHALVSLPEAQLH